MLALRVQFTTHPSPSKKRSHFHEVRGRCSNRIATCTNRIDHWSFLWIEPSVAKPFSSNCGSLDLLFADFSMILRILSPIFSQEKRERKTTRRTRENDAGITRASHFTKKVGHTGTGTTVLPDKIVLRSHARPKDDVEAKRASYEGRYSRYHCFVVHQFAGTKDCRLRVQQNTSLTHSQRRWQVRSILVGFGLHVTGNVNKASMVDAEIRAAQSERERNATREPILWRTSRR